ncbi:hypothetical protein BT96DRAFT_571963 [Gymnopus androsaceus JB14]|uniref:WKF domain-containing protein n=1 Tax=Gymnopus androsaceus JB14 TaxID=1447944 RepID=A0A6A4GIZ8_9AGAR|nr:hypothetical protein BT96DRAFT_571963 [Gymnopus androsaceus JB14]
MEAEVESVTALEKKKEKKQRKEKETEEADTPAEDVNQKERKKKRKREALEADQDSNQAAEPSRQSRSPRKRNPKTRLGFPIPSRKLYYRTKHAKLSYTPSHNFEKPSKWKFHKARQNWIVRNVWSIEKVPDSQMPLVLKYLSNVQGKTRENLTESCESIIAEAAVPPVPPAPATSEQEAVEQTAGEATQQPEKVQPANSIKALRAQALLSVLKGEVQV